MESYLKEGDGYIDITLKKPVTIGGAQVSTLRMREPTVRDQVAVAGESNAQAELKLFANLLEITVDDLMAFSLANYRRVQGAFENFTD